MSRLAQLEGLLAEDPESSFILFAIAKEYEGLKDLDRAISQYQTLAEKDPDYVGLYYHLGKAFEKQEKYDEAEAAYKKGIEVATKVRDMHAKGELEGALWEISED